MRGDVNAVHGPANAPRCFTIGCKPTHSGGRGASLSDLPRNRNRRTASRRSRFPPSAAAATVTAIRRGCHGRSQDRFVRRAAQRLWHRSGAGPCRSAALDLGDGPRAADDDGTGHRRVRGGRRRAGHPVSVEGQSRLAQQVQDYWADNLALWQRFVDPAAAPPPPPESEGDARDKRFKAAAWREDRGSTGSAAATI